MATCDRGDINKLMALQSGSGSGSGSSSGSHASCTTDDTTAMTECTNPLTDKWTKTPPTRDTVCKYYQEVFACYPACYCDDAAYKDAIDASLKAADDAVEAMGGGDCTVKCGSGTGSRSGSGVRRKFIIFCFFNYFFLRSSQKCFFLSSSFFFFLFSFFLSSLTN